MIEGQNGNGAINPNELKYPLTNVQITPNGIVVSVLYSPTITMNILLESGACDQIVKLWLQQKQQDRNMVDMAQRIQREKLA